MLNNKILVDSCVLIDLLDINGEFNQWSEETLFRFKESGFELCCNPVIFGEVSSNFKNIESVRDFFSEQKLINTPLNNKIMFNAAKTFRKYKRNGGKKETILADFAIGATAEHFKMILLTRDKGNFKTYFPKVSLIQPD